MRTGQHLRRMLGIVALLGGLCASAGQLAIGTAPSSRIIGEINERWGGRPAMLTAAAAVAVAALLMTRAFATMGPDAAAAGRARAAFAIT